jgi:hypothetical protein
VGCNIINNRSTIPIFLHYLCVRLLTCFIILSILNYTVLKKQRLASFRKSKSQKEEPAEVATTPGKIPRRGVLGKMGMKKNEKKSLIRTGSKSKNVQSSVQFPIKWETEPMPAPVDEETPVTEDAPADTTEPKDAEDDAPMEEESAAPVEEKSVEERGEEEEQPVAMEPEQTADSSAPVEEEQSVSEEREQPEEHPVMNTGFLCGCV